MKEKYAGVAVEVAVKACEEVAVELCEEVDVELREEVDVEPIEEVGVEPSEEVNIEANQFKWIPNQILVETEAELGTESGIHNLAFCDVHGNLTANLPQPLGD